MTLVVERRVMRLSTELIDEIGKVVQGSITLYLQGGGLFHCLLVAPSLDATVGVRAVYWERNENRFRAIELSRSDVLDAEREWTAPAERRPVSGHAPICSCNECQTRRFAPQHISPAPSVVGEAQRALELYVHPNAGDELAGSDTTGQAAELVRASAALGGDMREPLADLAMAVSALAERLRVVEAELAALRARTA